MQQEPTINQVIEELVQTKLKDPHNKEKIQGLQQLLDRLTQRPK